MNPVGLKVFGEYGRVILLCKACRGKDDDCKRCYGTGEEEIELSSEEFYHLTIALRTAFDQVLKERKIS